MQKFFVKREQIDDKNVEIIGTDVNHIINVLRMKKDDELQVCDVACGKNYLVKIVNFDTEKVQCEIVEKIDFTTETSIDIDIYEGLPKADKMELIIQKTTEIGVKKIIPVAMERSVVKLTDKDAIKKQERWQKIAEVAAKQSKRDIIPKVENVIKMSKIYEMINKYDVFIVAYENEKEITLKQILKQNIDAKKIGVLVGPEGGIDDKEIENLKQAGAKIVTLGNRILRTETAPIVLASNIIYELEN